GAVGAVPAPPTVKLPTQMTGTPARWPDLASRDCATAPYTVANGASRAEASEASPHQNAGSRMALVLFATKLGQMRFERGKRAFEPAAERGNARARGGHDCCARALVLVPRVGPPYELTAVVFHYVPVL